MVSPQSIRQCLLEKTTLTLEEAITSARSLEAAQKNTVLYQKTTFSTVAAMDNISNTEGTDNYTSGESLSRYSAAAVNKPGDSCFFCGKARHHQSRCPAKDSTCNKCGKKGHWSIACKSSNHPQKHLHQYTSVP